MKILNLFWRNSIFSQSKVYLNNFSKVSCYSTNLSGLNFPLNFKNCTLVNSSYYNRNLILTQKNKSLLFRNYTADIKEAKETKQEQSPKKISKFKQFYSQYGPTFLVVHLITVVLWIYGFFLISKQGYDITQILNLFHKMNLMAQSTVESIHHKIDNYKPKNGWVTGADIKHFATAYMVYKVIAPFRYMVSIGIVRVLVKNLRAKGLMKS